MKFRKRPAFKLLELPYEVWMQIAHLIPWNKRCKLIDFHRAFLDVVLEELYRDIRIYHELDESTLRCLFMGAVAACHVRNLTLRLHFFGESMRTTDGVDQLSVMWKPWKDRIQEKKKNRLSNDPVHPVVTQRLLRKIKQMTSLTSLVIGCYPSDDWRSFNQTTAFLDAAWTHASRLRKLKLDVPLECMAAILSTTPHFPTLEDLDILIRVESIRETHTNTLSKLATFINLQSFTLIRLAIDVLSLKIDPSPLFSGIQHLPKLIAVGIRQPLELLQTELNSAIDTFLREHRMSLRELRVSFDQSSSPYPHRTPTAFFSSSIFQIRFPTLEILDLEICSWDFKIDTSLSKELVKYLGKFRSTLKELTISGDILCFPVVQGITSLFGGVDMVLKYLKIRVHYLSCDLLDLLSRDLPRLDELVVNSDSVCERDDGNHEHSKFDPRSFRTHLWYRQYRSWGLRHLTMNTECSHCMPVFTCDRSRLVASFPNVSTFNGLSRGEFLTSKPDYTQMASLFPI